jgi:hypothetical protein
VFFASGLRNRVNRAKRRKCGYKYYVSLMSRMTGFEPKVLGHKDCTRKRKQDHITQFR